MPLTGIHSEKFEAAVAPLLVPGAGTAAVGPFLASLVGLVRPTNVLEVGMGYTTPFLAAALAAAEKQAAAESAALARKSRAALAAGGELDDAWLFAEPPLAAPEFHRTPYRPRLVAVDNLSIEGSSAGRVSTALAELGLDRLVTVANCDLVDADQHLPADFDPIDLAWVDAYECLWFFDHYWERINPDGGLLAMHYLMTYPEGEAVLRYFRGFQRANPGQLEIVNLLEPHKLMQNSVTLIRRTAAPARDKVGRAGHVRYSAELTASARSQAGADR